MCKYGTDTVVMVPIDPACAWHGQFRWEPRKIDSCLADLIWALNRYGMYTANCCCGHGKGPGSIIFHDGQELILPTIEVTL